MKIGIVGTGISGLSAAWLLNQVHDTTVFEQAPRLGGHSNTVDANVTGPAGDKTIAVDTGFIVFNDRTYPNLVALFDHLGVATHDSNMSFSVSARGGRLEYSGSSVWHLFAQPTNLLRPRHHRMIRDILRFYREAPTLLALPANDDGPTLGGYLKAGGYGASFIDDHLLPMGAAIWSSTCAEMMQFPARSFIQFCHNHGLLTVADRPTWRTVSGGSRSYVKALSAPFAGRVLLGRGAAAIERHANGVSVRDTAGDWHWFDEVVLACHADQALALIGDADEQERDILGALRYQANRAVLHTDTRLMPRRRRIWSSWNYMSDAGDAAAQGTSVTYWMNQLQNLDQRYPLFVSLNPHVEPAKDTVIAEFDYDHPQFDHAALVAQGRLAQIQGRDRLWFAGSYCGYGFHEDGLSAGLSVAESLGGARPWAVQDVSPAGRNALPAAPRVPLAIAAE